MDKLAVVGWAFLLAGVVLLVLAAYGVYTLVT
jgi:hypothetical protein